MAAQGNAYSRSLFLIGDIRSEKHANCEARHHARRPLLRPGKLLGQDIQAVDITIIDISKTGVGIWAEDAKRIGEPCALAFDVTVNNASRRINAWGKIAYCETLLNKSGYRIGIRFKDFDMSSKTYIEVLCAGSMGEDEQFIEISKQQSSF